MATGDIPMRSSGLSDIQAILDMVTAKTTNTSNTTNSSEIVSPEKSAEFINQMLSGTAGLAAVSGAQKASGLYGSTTNKLLTNDLLARTAAQAAALSATKTSTTNGSTIQQAPVNSGNAAGFAGAALAGKALSSFLGNKAKTSNSSGGGAA